MYHREMNIQANDSVSGAHHVDGEAWRPFEVETSMATLSGARHCGPGPTVLFLHGLGSSSDDIAGAAEHAELSTYRIEAIDLPGHRSSRWRTKNETDSLLACVELLSEFVADHIDGELAIVGHSVGGAIGVLLADRLGQRCRGFIDIEGNLIDSDCGALSRPTAARLDWERDELFQMIDEHLADNPVGGTQGYLDRYRANVGDHREWVAYTRALVDHSADGSLLERFMALRCWRSYIYGADDPPEVAGLLAVQGIPVTSIAGSGHWPMYAQPTDLHDAIADDLRHAFGNQLDVASALSPPGSSSPTARPDRSCIGVLVVSL
jgi:pimeloyl-ACP methyl ester carboxylesterase